MGADVRAQHEWAGSEMAFIGMVKRRLPYEGREVITGRILARLG